MSDQREVEVHVALVNTTSSWVSLFPSMALNAETLPPITRLVKHTTINALTIHSRPRRSQLRSNSVGLTSGRTERADRHVVAPHTYQGFSLRIALTPDLRSTESPVFRVRYHIFVIVHL